MAATPVRAKSHRNGALAAAALSAELRELRSRAAAAVDIIATPTQRSSPELGLDGIGNYGGDLQAEANSALRGLEGYGAAGTRQWGRLEENLRTDEAVSAALDFIAAPIRDGRINVEAADDSPLAKQQADFLRWNLTEGLEPSWAELLQQLVRNTLGLGFSLHEVVLAATEHPLLPSGRGYKIAKLAERLASTLSFNAWQEDAAGQLRSIRQRGPKGGRWETVDLPVERVLLTTWNRNGNNYAGYSAFRPVQYAIKAREHFLKLGIISLVREGAGIPIAFTKDAKATLSKAQRASLQKLLQNLVYHENASAVMPTGWEMAWIYSPGANKGHVIDAFNALGLLILRQLGAQQLVLGTNETGSRSVGEVHSAANEVVVRGVLANLLGTLNGVPGRAYTGLAQRCIDPNWGPQTSYPRIGITLPRSKLKPLEKAQALKVAKEAGVFTPTLCDENAFREEMGLGPIAEADRESTARTEPEADDGEPGPVEPGGAPKKLVEGVKPQDTAFNEAQMASGLAIVQSVSAGQLPVDAGLGMLEAFLRMSSPEARRIMGSVATGWRPARAEPATTEEFDSTRRASAAGAPASFTPWRPLRESERHLNLGAMVATLDRAPLDFADGARPLVAELLMRALPEVKAAMADGDPSEVAGLRLDTARLDAFVAKFLEQLRAEGYAQVKSEARRGLNAALALGTLRAAGEEDPNADLKDAATPPARAAAEKVLAGARKQLVRRMQQRILSDLELAAVDVIRTGDEPEEAVTRTLERQVSSGAYRADAGLVTTKAFNVGRQEFAEEHGADVAGVELSEAMDENTCAPCERLDGMELEFGSDEEREFTPPHSSVCLGGDRCRGIKLFKFKRVLL